MPVPLETYDQAIEYLFGRINYERVQPDAYGTNDFKLDRMRGLLNEIDDPQLRLPAIHVAGTKGKGSVCSMLASILTASGFRTGLYTSPHLHRFEERIAVDGTLPSPHEVVALVNRLRPVVAGMDRSPSRMHPTFFELATAMAWLYFLDQSAQFAVLETGLGGRLDSTNLCRPLVTTITNISRDHQQILGSTIGQIAAEKAGIIKSGVPVVSGCRHPEAIPVVESIARQQGSDLWLLDREIHWDWSDRAHGRIRVTTPRCTRDHIPVPLRGRHQAENTALAIATLDRLPEDRIPDEEQVESGLRRVRWPARIEVVSERPTVILDAAHNWESARALATTLRQDFPSQRRVLIFACSRDKDYRGVLRLLLPLFETVIFTKYVENPRAISPEELQQFAQILGDFPAHVTGDPCSAWKLARRLSRPEDMIVITGSLFLAAELREVVSEGTTEPIEQLWLQESPGRRD